MTEVPRETPTEGSNTVLLGLQSISVHQYELNMGDIKSAFLQGGRLDRDKGPLFGEHPTLRGVPKGAVIELQNYVYGLVDALRKWYETLDRYLTKELGAKRSALDPAVFIWHQTDHTLQGIMMVHVDDVACGGTAEVKRGDAQNMRNQRHKAEASALGSQQPR